MYNYFFCKFEKDNYLEIRVLNKFDKISIKN
jgi:hypothetical protein